MEQRTRLIRLIHIGKRELGLDDETYRALLQRETGKDSCKNMLNNELDTVLRVMERQGFKRKKTSKPSQNKKRLSPKTQGQPTVISKIRALWITMAKDGVIRDGSEAALNAYVRRMTKNQTGRGVDNLAWCSAQEALNVIERLKRWQKRTKNELKH
ncbi:gp16 family protein [Grimontia sp. NTOU-MAR1]|uniref:gp16 family protein n=1 Tax=Grimontia sp. NTOU-MAR1 TaxID=3111011 RepID=UPI002DB90B48|nr:regulatory protein GemA [Grimontia sp. NTOU-MAR1]WRV98550.1 regulatory protein GemA [Grimontia sp. NTOU-MAR1]